MVDDPQRVVGLREIRVELDGLLKVRNGPSVKLVNVHSIGLAGVDGSQVVVGRSKPLVQIEGPLIVLGGSTVVSFLKENGTHVIEGFGKLVIELHCFLVLIEGAIHVAVSLKIRAFEKMNDGADLGGVPGSSPGLLSGQIQSCKEQP